MKGYYSKSIYKMKARTKRSQQQARGGEGWWMRKCTRTGFGAKYKVKGSRKYKSLQSIFAMWHELINCPSCSSLNECAAPAGVVPSAAAAAAWLLCKTTRQVSSSCSMPEHQGSQLQVLPARDYGRARAAPPPPTATSIASTTPA